MKSLPKTGKVKGYACINKKGELLMVPYAILMGIFSSQIAAKNFAQAHDDIAEILPCTITYQLPHPKRRK